MEYYKTPVQEELKIKSIVTVYHRKIKLEPFKASAGESHDFPELLYIISGQCTLMLDERRYELNEGELIIYSPNSFHTAILPTAAEVYIISFELEGKKSSELYNRIFKPGRKEKEILSQIVADGAKSFKSLPRGRELCGMRAEVGISEAQLQAMKIKIELLLLSLLCEDSSRKTEGLSCTKNQSEILFCSVVEYMYNNLGRALTLKDIAQDNAISVSKLKSIFKERTGGGALEFFAGIRLERAKERIKESQDTLTQIAAELGFSSVHYFSRFFKQKTGISPSEYSKE